MLDDRSAKVDAVDDGVETITIGRFNADFYLEGNVIDVRHYPTARSADWVAEEFAATKT